MLCFDIGKEVGCYSLQSTCEGYENQQASRRKIMLRNANKYEINSVPKTQKDFLADLVKMGIDVDNFLLADSSQMSFAISNHRMPERSFFGMISDVTDIDVAKKILECAQLVELMEKYTTEELTASE